MDKVKIYKLLPHILQNAAITLYDYLQYKKRRGVRYYEFKKLVNETNFSSIEVLESLQNEALIKYLTYVKEFSPYFKERLLKVDISKGKSILKDIPICSKEEFRLNIPNIVTGDINTMHEGNTGGTTGNSMKIYFEYEDMEERFAILDSFRERFGYTLGEKTAWFSGNDILTIRDLKCNRFWKKDWLYRIKYYSTFEISAITIPYYIEDLKKFKPKFIVGFPSSIVEIARFGIENNIELGYQLKAIFPTAESKVESEVVDLVKFFGCGVYDQYASSEGACLITECEKGNMHMEVLSGIIEVVDEQDRPSTSGRMLITSFSTRGTPLLRYDIGDMMEWSTEGLCACRRETPLVKKIYGRINDFIYSKEKGKCNLGNLSNCVKYVNGIVKFQAIQDDLDLVKIRIQKNAKYKKEDETRFLSQLRDRLGEKIDIKFIYVDKIEREKSGKYRIVKNSIKEQV